jgi:hypothetical protein
MGGRTMPPWIMMKLFAPLACNHAACMQSRGRVNATEVSQASACVTTSRVRVLYGTAYGQPYTTCINQRVSLSFYLRQSWGTIRYNCSTNSHLSIDAWWSPHWADAQPHGCAWQPRPAHLTFESALFVLDAVAMHSLQQCRKHRSTHSPRCTAQDQHLRTPLFT